MDRLCPFHRSSGKDPVQQVGILDNIQNKPVSRREFFTFTWLEQYAQDFTHSFVALPRPIQVLGGASTESAAEYLAEIFINYFIKNQEIEYMFPFRQVGTSEMENTKRFKLGDREIRPRIINRNKKRANSEIKYVNYRTGIIYKSSAIIVEPHRTKVELATKIPSGFEGGVEVIANPPVETRHILKLKLGEKAHQLNESPVFHFSIPIEDVLPLDVQMNNSLLIAGKDGELLHISDILSLVRGNTIHLDRNLLLQVFEDKGAEDGMLVVQLEGRFKRNLKLDSMTQRFLPGGNQSKEEIRFETTAEAIPVTQLLHQ
jgi:hypothetical protein